MNIEWDKVTWYSKVTAVALFVATFIVAFNLGRAYEEQHPGSVWDRGSDSGTPKDDSDDVVGGDDSGNSAVTPPHMTQPPVACTAEAKQCPDGSWVGRTGPNCEFVCPTSGGSGIAPYHSGVTGSVTLGPTCPVMQDPPNPQCADKAYSVTVSVYRQGSASVFASVKSGTDGRYTFSLPPGTYMVTAGSGSSLPRCSSVENVVVGPTGYVTTDISCDTGIR